MARRKMSDEHKAALAKGRAEGRAVRRYLAALEAESRAGRKPDRGTLETRLSSLQQQVDDEADPARRLELIQQRLDVESQLAEDDDGPDIEDLEREFVSAAKGYSERKGITYTAWREIGVPARVLREAGIPRTRRPS